MKLVRIIGAAVVASAMLGCLVVPGVALAAPPSNDDASGAISITTIPFVVDIDMSQATVGPDDPASCPGDPAGMVTTWYRLEPTFATPRWIGISAASAGTQSRALSVAAPGAGAPGASCDLVPQWILVQPGARPWVVVEAAVPPGGSGPVEVTLNVFVATAPPANDRSSRAVVVSKFPFVDDVDMAGATHGANDPKTCRGPLIEQGVRPDQTVWYRLDYPYRNAHRVGVRVSGPFNNGFWVVSRPGGTVITCADDPTGDGAHGSFTARPGQRYWIVVGKGTPEHSASEPVRIRISATQVDEAVSPADATLPDTGTASSDRFVPTPDGRDGSGPPLLPIVVGAIALGVFLRRRPVVRGAGASGR